MRPAACGLAEDEGPGVKNQNMEIIGIGTDVTECLRIRG